MSRLKGSLVDILKYIKLDSSDYQSASAARASSGSLVACGVICSDISMLQVDAVEKLAATLRRYCRFPVLRRML
jgi:hypothetical protein